MYKITKLMYKITKKEFLNRYKRKDLKFFLTLFT